ncbi:hypothetical protein FAF44_33805 [Nonomuraea sp. MG754425]|uniref:hypothetical protein n=1 Tax=Nonomuraea sp. MG754425 TaxID=2570319 RepID=UPI001F4579C0|nr:hypothetical protein [Nonomuraea sp. MG754425]MCF6473323.1 hypothetical protein [Nonomuraea sp. MG754425]
MSASTSAAGFSPAGWERSYRRAVRSAFARVPFYRDQWVRAGRALDTPVPTPCADLEGQAHRLCPFTEPYDAGAEPSLWIGAAAELRAALSTVGAARRAPVLEVRRAVLDRRALGPFRDYGVLLAADAKVRHERRRQELNEPALRLATAAGRAIVVGERAAVAEFLPALSGVETRVLERAGLDGAARSEVVHDRCLGYYAARARCGHLHLLWRRFHARPTDDGALAVTALRRRRPVLVDVVPDGLATLGRCPVHHTPVLGVTP